MFCSISLTIQESLKLTIHPALACHMITQHTVRTYVSIIQDIATQTEIILLPNAICRVGCQCTKQSDNSVWKEQKQFDNFIHSKSKLAMLKSLVETKGQAP